MSRFCKFGKLHVTKGNVDKLLGILLTASKELKRSLAPTGNLNSKNEAIVILNNYFKGGVGKSKLSTMFAYLTDKLNLKVLMIDKDLQATLTKDLAKTFKVELPRVNFYEGLKNGNLASSIVHLTDNLDLIPGTFDLMLLPKLTRSWTFENESRLLATLLAPLKSDYDLIIIDTVPTPSVYTNNAIVASDYVMIPLQAEEESTNNIQLENEKE